MRRCFLIGFIVLSGTATAAADADLVAVTDGINYNAGSRVSIRFEPKNARTYHANVRYAGEETPVVSGVVLDGKDGAYIPLWTIPFDARTGRYEVDIDGV